MSPSFPCAEPQNPRYLREGLKHSQPWSLNSARTLEKASSFSRTGLEKAFWKRQGAHFSFGSEGNQLGKENGRKTRGWLRGSGQRALLTPSSHLGASRSSIFRRGCWEETSAFSPADLRGGGGGEVRSVPEWKLKPPNALGPCRKEAQQQIGIQSTTRKYSHNQCPHLVGQSS